MIPTVTIPTNKANSFSFTAFLSIIIDGNERAVTAIIKDNIVPSPAPLANKLSATGIVPNISAYIGTPTSVAKITENGFFPPRTL